MQKIWEIDAFIFKQNFHTNLTPNHYNCDKKNFYNRISVSVDVQGYACMQVYIQKIPIQPCYHLLVNIPDVYRHIHSRFQQGKIHLFSQNPEQIKSNYV